MSVLYVMIPLALLLAVGAIAAFAWSVRGGQLDDLDTPPLRVLFDDDEADAPGPAGTPDAPGSHGTPAQTEKPPRPPSDAMARPPRE